MDFLKELVYRYPLTEQRTPNEDLFRLDKRRFVLFWREPIEKQNIEPTLNAIESTLKSFDVQGGRSVVVVAKTTESFKKNELVYFDSIRTLVVFYLIDEQENRIYKNASWTSFWGMGYKKIVRRIDEVVTSLLLEKSSFNDTND